MATLVIAMVLAAAITHAFEQGKARSAARWQDARRRAEERGAARERERQRKAAEWETRWDAAISSGPRRPLWWVYATGYLTGGAVLAVGAGLVGVYSGAIAGAKSGYRVGVEAGRKGSGYRQAWHEWRRENPGEPVELGQCQRCGGWIAARDLSENHQFGQVCPDCVPVPSPEQPSAPGADEPDDPADTEAVHDFREYIRQWKTRDERCAKGCGRVALPGETWCGSCRLHWIQIQQEQERMRRERERHAQHPPPREEPPDSQGPIRVTAERIYPEPEEETQPKEITNTMNALPSANSSSFSGTGEGYTDTVQSLESLARLMGTVHEKVTNLNEMLTANSLDLETLNRLSELTDGIESITTQAQELHKHVVNTHNPMAEATAAAGGSSNVATKTFYDDL